MLELVLVIVIMLAALGWNLAHPGKQYAPLPKALPLGQGLVTMTVLLIAIIFVTAFLLAPVGRYLTRQPLKSSAIITSAAAAQPGSTRALIESAVNSHQRFQRRTESDDEWFRKDDQRRAALGRAEVITKPAFGCRESTMHNRVLARADKRFKPSYAIETLEELLQQGNCIIWDVGTKVRGHDIAYGTITCYAKLDDGMPCYWTQNDAVQPH
jgi:hypothetical protein